MPGCSFPARHTRLACSNASHSHVDEIPKACYDFSVGRGRTIRSIGIDRRRMTACVQQEVQMWHIFKSVTAIALCVVLGTGSAPIHKLPEAQADYGVFLGIDRTERDRLNAYRIVVIEPSEFDPADIKTLHQDGKTVYGYLNIGALEQYRPYFNRFRHITLGVYDHWPDERWVDVSYDIWQDFLVSEAGKQYADMGLDGLFLDNADVYYHYPRQDIFEGLCAILKGLKAHGLQLIINGGDTFVSKCIQEHSAAGLFDGINQECVFTSIDFEHNSYGKQQDEERSYFQEYLAGVKASGLSVFLLEYGADASLSEQISAYCKTNGFFWYNAEGKELK